MRYAGGGDRPSHGGLVAVGGGGIDRAVPGLEGRRDRGLGVGLGHLVDAEPEDGHLDAVVERDVLHGLAFQSVARAPLR